MSDLRVHARALEAPALVDELRELVEATLPGEYERDDLETMCLQAASLAVGAKLSGPGSVTFHRNGGAPVMVTVSDGRKSLSQNVDRRCFRLRMLEARTARALDRTERLSP